FPGGLSRSGPGQSRSLLPSARVAMADLAIHPLEAILRQCAEAAPQPWYPSTYAQATGVPRDRLDADLDLLRLGGLVHLTDWVQGKGQGYALTDTGREVLQSPRLLARLRSGSVPVFRDEAPPPPERAEGQPTTWER